MLGYLWVNLEETIVVVVMPMVIFAIALLIVVKVILVGIEFVQEKRYEQTEYFKQTHNPYKTLRKDKGLTGEYYIYKRLKPLTGYKRFLFNCYVPKSNDERTEIDVLLIHESGIYVFESKNYSGWIFGKESDRYWTQTLPVGRGRSQKSRFLNPIIQNRVHLKWLKEFLQDDSLCFYSYIAFSERCTLKNIRLTSGEHRVMNRYHLLSDVEHVAQNTGKKLTSEQVDSLYRKLYALTQIDDSVKHSHIERIHNKYQPSSKNRGKDQTCPWCGGQLVLRTASKGSRKGKRFWGCSHYPKCRYMRNK
ncbi:MAG: NERD domain-containing protein [Lachnospiraceae bacterium]